MSAGPVSAAVVRGTGRYFDGERAVRREVEVEIAPGGVRVLPAGSGGRELAFWRYRDLRPVDEPAGGGPRRIRTRNGKARLVVEDPVLLAALSARAPRLAARGPGRVRLGLRWAVLLALSVAVLLAAVRFGLPRFADEAARIVPRQWEAALGESLVGPVVRTLARFDDVDEAAFCTAPRGVESLDGLTRRLAPAASPYRFVVRVVDLEMVNAFALPGGRILITEGLLRFAESPDEVAGVLAHEMGHVLHRHSTAAMVEALGLAFLFGAMLGDFGTGAVGSGAETLVGLRFRREAETEADERGIDLLGRAGLSSRGLADFFERIQRKAGGGSRVLRLLSTHPPSELRRRRAKEAAAPAPPALDEREWRNLEAICSRRQPLDP